MKIVIIGVVLAVVALAMAVPRWRSGRLESEESGTETEEAEDENEKDKHIGTSKTAAEGAAVDRKILNDNSTVTEKSIPDGEKTNTVYGGETKTKKNRKENVGEEQEVDGAESLEEAIDKIKKDVIYSISFTASVLLAGIFVALMKKIKSLQQQNTPTSFHPSQLHTMLAQTT